MVQNDTQVEPTKGQQLGLSSENMTPLLYSEFDGFLPDSVVIWPQSPRLQLWILISNPGRLCARRPISARVRPVLHRPTRRGGGAASAAVLAARAGPVQRRRSGPAGRTAIDWRRTRQLAAAVVAHARPPAPQSGRLIGQMDVRWTLSGLSREGWRATVPRC